MVKADGQIKRATAKPPADTEQRILDAAHAVFVRRGSAGARTQEIAAEAGVNKALLHYYFRSKDRLAEAVFRRAASQLLPVAIGVLSSELELEQKVERVVDLYMDQLLKSPYLPGYILSELAHHPERVRQLFAEMSGGIQPDHIKRRVLATLKAQIDERVRAGTMAPITPDQFLINLMSLCVFPFAARPMFMAVLDLDEKGFERMIERRRKQLPGFFLRGLRS